MNFTKKHEEWSLFFGLRPSTRLIWSCIIRKTQGDKPTEIEIDLNQINKWIAKKRGKGYDRKTLKLAMAQLEERTEGLIVIIKKYSWHCYKLLVRPLYFLSEKKSQNKESSTLDNHGDLAFSEVSQDRKVKQQQQDLSKINKLLQKVGLRYDSEALARIWQLSGQCIERVVSSIELMLYRHSSVTDIKRPHGFIIECLKRGWAEKFNLYYEPELPRFRCADELREYVKNIKAGLVAA